MRPLRDGTPRWVLAFAAVALGACTTAPPPPSTPGRSVAETAALGAGPAAEYARALEDRRRGIGIPPAQPAPGTVDRLPGQLRASRPAPGTGPAGPPPAPPPVPGNSQSRLSALPASPLANPPGGFTPGRP